MIYYHDAPEPPSFKGGGQLLHVTIVCIESGGKNKEKYSSHDLPTYTNI